MANHDPIVPDRTQELDRLGHAEIVVGLTTLNSAKTVRQVVEATRAGLSRFFAGRSSVLVVADGGSGDGTVEAARQSGGEALVVMTGPTPSLSGPVGGDAGLPGKGNGVRGIFAAAERLGAAACAVLDGDARSLAPEWVRFLVEPVLLEGLDLVAPVYARHRYDGLLTTSLLYPLTRALYGRRLRQPVGGHFGFSGAMVRRLLSGGAWNGAVARYRLDAWITTSALADALPVGQAFLGPGRRRAGAAAVELGGTFARAVGTVFGLMEEYRPAWWSVVETGDVPTFGVPQPVGDEPVSVNVDRMVSTFRQGLVDLMPVWRRALARETCEALELLDAGGAAFQFPAALWAQVVYDGAVAHHQRLLPREHLLRALIPLYLGRVASLVIGTTAAAAAAMEQETEAMCGAFESVKPYLLDRWDARRP